MEELKKKLNSQFEIELIQKVSEITNLKEQINIYEERYEELKS